MESVDFLDASELRDFVNDVIICFSVLHKFASTIDAKNQSKQSISPKFDTDLMKKSGAMGFSPWDV